MANFKTRKEIKPMSEPVCIVGGGWSGLACAVYLASHNIPVRVLEAAPQLGGRARAVPGFDGLIDNGQHLFIGGYHHLKLMFEQLKLNTSELFFKQPCQWAVKSETKSIALKLPRLKAPWHGLLATLMAQGLSMKEKWQLIRFCQSLQKPLTKDCSVQELLTRSGLSKIIIDQLFEPLCLAALTTSSQEASSQIFTQVLRDAFLHQASDSDFWFAKPHLSDVLPTPAQCYLEQRGHQVDVGSRVEELILNRNQIMGVRTKKETIQARAVVLATPYWVTAKLIEPVSNLKSIANQCQQLQSESITTVYCQFPKDVRLEVPMTGLSGTLSQWIFDRAFADQPGLIAVVISGSGSHQGLSHPSLAQQVLKELQTFFPQCKKCLNFRVIHEKRGAFACTVEAQKNRPNYLTPVDQLYLAGDYCKNPYPATLEGAVLNGQKCAQEVIQRLNHDINPPMSICA